MLRSLARAHSPVWKRRHESIIVNRSLYFNSKFKLICIVPWTFEFFYKPNGLVDLVCVVLDIHSWCKRDSYIFNFKYSIEMNCTFWIFIYELSLVFPIRKIIFILCIIHCSRNREKCELKSASYSWWHQLIVLKCIQFSCCFLLNKLFQKQKPPSSRFCVCFKSQKFAYFFPSSCYVWGFLSLKFQTENSNENMEFILNGNTLSSSLFFFALNSSLGCFYQWTNNKMKSLFWNH